nr:hypothetical protein [Deltaproteobacteria bacterium]
MSLRLKYRKGIVSIEGEYDVGPATMVSCGTDPKATFPLVKGCISFLAFPSIAASRLGV